MGARLDRAKAHVKKNKAIYIGTAVGVAGVATGVILGRRNTAIVLQYKPEGSPITLTQIVELVRRGHPGKVLRCIETGEVFASQNRAASTLGIDPGAIARYLAGSNPTAGGYTFEYLGDAA